MDYRETPPPNSLLGLVKAFWTLDAASPGQDWLQHQATPDGCVELIIRAAGRSRWTREQPERFVVGLNDSPIDFEISGDARFSALRIWPWTWRLISGASPVEILGRWEVPDDRLADIFGLIARPDPDLRLLSCLFSAEAQALRQLGLEILAAQSVADLGRRTGMPPRTLQRWFATNVGLPPRSYLRVLRFQQAFEQLPDAESLAHHAADHGFSDQSHMAREFRRLAGEAASDAKPKMIGPFLD